MDIKLVVVGGKHAGMEIPVRGPKFRIGRGRECRLRPQSNLISRKHCAITVGADSATIKDYGSTNGTFVNGEKVEKQQELKNGDRIKVGVLELEVVLGAAVAVKAEKPAAAQPAKQAAAEKAPAEKAPAKKAAAAAKAPAAGDDDLDISSWLADDDADDGPAAQKPAGLHDTSPGKKIDETVAMEPAPEPQGKQKKPPAKIVGQFQRATKPKAESSGAAASEMLRQFSSKKK
jgi:hypothetical protein